MTIYKVANLLRGWIRVRQGDENKNKVEIQNIS